MSHFVVFFLLILSSKVDLNCSSDIINTHVTLIVDISSQLVYVDYSISFYNRGVVDSLKNRYRFIVGEPDRFVIDFFNENGKKLHYNYVNNTALTTIPVNEQNQFVLIDVHLDKFVGSSDPPYKLICKIIYLKKLRPVYKTRRYNTSEITRFNGNLFYLSLYETEYFQVDYRIGKNTNTSMIVELSAKPQQYLLHPDYKLLAYSFTKLKALSYRLFEIVFVNSKPFITVESHERIYDVSHFGRISVENRVTLRNEGDNTVYLYLFN